MAASLVAACPNLNWHTLRRDEALPGATDVSAAIADFHDSGEFLASCDAVVTVDTSTAHLAGALGLPTFLLLSTGGEWRWSPDVAPWYPSIRVLRQTTVGDWAPAIAELRTRLGALPAAA